MKNLVKILFSVCIVFAAVPATYAQVTAEVGISANIAPPEMPVYTQPACPVDGYLWQPGYWAYAADGGYYWVPGVWVAPPNPGYLWTPPYWGFAGGAYGFHAGYWGAHVGFYGGINYGFGYGGEGFFGGRWDGGRFRYNTAVFNVDRRFVRNTYIDRTVVRNVTVNRYSFNGPGGADRRPNANEEAVMRERHINATSRQMAHQQDAMRNKAQFANVNHGHPAAVAMSKPGGRAFNEQGHAAARTQQVQRNNQRTQRAQQQQHQNAQVQRNQAQRSQQQQHQNAQVQRNQAQRAQQQQHQNAQVQHNQAQRAQQQQRRPAQQRQPAQQHQPAKPREGHK